MTGIEMDRDDIGLEDHFAAARGTAPAPSGALMARVLADAEAAMPRAAAPPLGSGPRPRNLPAWLGAFGGWGGIGGLATAAAAGLWFGYAGLTDPASLAAGLIDGATAQEATELLPGGEVAALLAGWEG